jgi:hypothetical protein
MKKERNAQVFLLKIRLVIFGAVVTGLCSVMLTEDKLILLQFSYARFSNSPSTSESRNELHFNEGTIVVKQNESNFI